MAVYIPDYKLTFIHIPKTAGSSIESWLKEHTTCFRPKRSLHCRVEHAKQHFEDIGRTFCVVRNPYDWMVSWYEYERKTTQRYINEVQTGKRKKFNINKEKHNLDLLFEKQANLEKGFKPFLLNTRKPTQYSWAKDVDIVLKFEHLISDFKKIQKIIGSKKPLPIINPTIRKPWPEYYDNESKEFLLDYFSEDFDFLANL